MLVALTAATVAVDYWTGATIRFPFIYMLPVLTGAWFEGFLAGTAAGAFLIGVRVFLETRVWTVPWPLHHTLVNAASGLITVAIFSWYCALAGRLTREVGLLWGLLPICMHCRRIRTETREWQGLEDYVMKRSEARFTHGICPDCLKKHYPEA